MRLMTAILGAMLGALAMAGCAPTSGPTFATSADPGQTLTANVGDTVLDARTVLPDLMWGTIETGRTIVRFTRVDGRRAVFTRDHLVLSDRFDSALWTPTGVPVSPIAGYTTATQPLEIALRPGEIMPLEGRRLTVRGVSRNSLQYTLEDMPPRRP
ncbi:MAG TPA: hypothetical protein VJ890_13520 [Vineibacter sp.]|nr:hypothetical protein [Vineibacter sp.]